MLFCSRPQVRMMAKVMTHGIATLLIGAVTACLCVIWIKDAREAYRLLREEYKLRGLDDFSAAGLAMRAAVFPPVARYYIRKYRRDRGA